MSKDSKKNNQDEIKLNFYTGCVMLSALVSAIVTAICLVFTAKPIYSATDFWFGKGKTSEEVDAMGEAVLSFAKSEKMQFKYAYAIAACCVAATICTIVAILRISDLKKKPIVLCGIVAFAASVAAIVICVNFRNYAEDLCKIFMDENYEILLEDNTVKGSNYNIYSYCFYAVIANCAIQLMGIAGLIFGRLKWNKEYKNA